MKAFIALVTFFVVSSASAVEFGALVNVSCEYKVKKQIKRPLVMVGKTCIKNDCDNGTKTMTLSVAYVINGKKIVENAVVTNVGYTEGLEGFGLRAVTTSGRVVELTIYVENSNSWITVDGVAQTHMTGLECSADHAG